MRRGFFLDAAFFFRAVAALPALFLFAAFFAGAFFFASFFLASFFFGAAFFRFACFFLGFFLVAIRAVYHWQVMLAFQRFGNYLISVQGCAWFKAYFATAFSSNSKPRPGV